MSKMFVHYSGTVADFSKLTNIEDYNNKIVFIKGGADGTGAAIYTHGNYYANLNDALAGLTYISGVKSGNVTATAQGPNGIIEFSADDPATVSVEAGSTGVTIGLTAAFKNSVSDNTTAIAANTEAIATLNGSDTGKSVREVVLDEVAAQLISENITDSFDTLKEMAEYLSSHPEDVTEINNRLTTLEGLVTSTSVATQITDAINALDVTDTAVTGKYVSAVSETDGKISVTRADLPTYTLATGTANGTVKFNGTDISVKGLGSAAYTESSAYATAALGTKADNAAPQATTYTKTEVDNLFAWEEL